jgi:hypothetical protein
MPGIGIGIKIGKKSFSSNLPWDPKVPINLVLAVLSNTSIKLDWTNIDTTGDGVSIERSLDGISYAEIDTVILGVSTYTDNTCLANTLYYYRIKAYKGEIYSDPSNVVFATTMPAYDFMRTVGTGDSNYQTLYDAFFDINNAILTGVIIFQIINSTQEYAQAEIFESGYGGSPGYTYILVYPTVPGLRIDGTVTPDLIQFNHCSNVHIDGRVNLSGDGDFTIENLSEEPGATTLHYIGATNTDVLHCNVIGDIVVE